MAINFIKKSQLYFIGSFLLLIFLGTLLLKLPFIRLQDAHLSWTDAIFTAVSASCVTGLSVVDTSSFSLFGQLVILGLIQIGGIGIMSLSAGILVMMGRHMSFSNTLLISSLSDNFSLHGTESLTRIVIWYTFGIEALGALLLFPGFLLEGLPLWTSAYYAIYHSISAFCNAGFSPLNGSLVGMSAWIKIVCATLIVFGGLGVYVVYDLRQYFRPGRKVLRVATKLMLIASALLLVIGMLLIKVEQELSPTAPGVGWVDAFFTSASARTAGFNSIDLGTLSGGSMATIIILMLIGACPGSTGGGMKLSTVALAAAALYSTVVGHRKVLLFRREIPTDNVLKAYVIIVMFILLATFGAMLLMWFVPLETPMEQCLFEVSSALGTAGYSLGISAASDDAGKWLLSLFMFMGRVGPFTAFLFLMGRDKASWLKYPEERVVIG